MNQSVLGPQKPFDLFTEFAKFASMHQISLRDPKATMAFTNYVGESIDRTRSDPIRLHGQRAQAMFEAMLVSLGGYHLLKVEDTGRIYPEDRFKVPDFRLVLTDRTQWLIEVKNVYIADSNNQRRRLMRRAYLEKLKSYAACTGGLLKVAVYWAQWGFWTLVSPERLIDIDGNLTLDMHTALAVNELSRLGDRMIGTRPPLRLRLTVDPARTSSVGPDGKVEVTIARAQIYCGEDEVLDPVEEQIAWLLMRYGEWKESQPELLMDGDRPKTIELQWEPKVQENDGFEIVGSLSQIFTRYYAEQTVEDREVVQTLAPPRPKWFEPLVRSEYERKALPLWQFILQPNFAILGGKRDMNAE